MELKLKLITASIITYTLAATAWLCAVGFPAQ